MNRLEFRASIDALYERLYNLTATKGEEYKRAEDNQFSNFERGAAGMGLTREQILLVYLSKHIDSIHTFVKDAANGTERQYAEPIEGRIDDAILYLLLLRGMVTEQPGTRIDVRTLSDVGPRSVAGSPPPPVRPEAIRVPVPVPEVVSQALEGANDRVKRDWGAPEYADDRFMTTTPFSYSVTGPITLDDLQKMVSLWADNTFGARIPSNAWLKMFSELGEVIDNPNDPLEWADLFIMLLDLSKMFGIELTAAILQKLDINCKRKWEHRNGVFKHVKE